MIEQEPTERGEERRVEEREQSRISICLGASTHRPWSAADYRRLCAPTRPTHHPARGHSRPRNTHGHPARGIHSSHTAKVRYKSRPVHGGKYKPLGGGRPRSVRPQPVGAEPRTNAAELWTNAEKTAQAVVRSGPARLVAEVGCRGVAGDGRSSPPSCRGSTESDQGRREVEARLDSERMLLRGCASLYDHKWKQSNNAAHS